MPHTAANCSKWFLVQRGDDCSKAETGGIIADEFFTWNPDVSKDCQQNFWLGYAYCIGIDVAESELTATSNDSNTIANITSSTEFAPSSVSTDLSTSTWASSATTAANSLAAPYSNSTTDNPTAPYSIRNPITSWNITAPTKVTTFPPNPTQSGQPNFCIDRHFVSVGDTCDTIVNRYGSSLTVDDLISLESTARPRLFGPKFWILGLYSYPATDISYPLLGPAIHGRQPTKSDNVHTHYTPGPHQYILHPTFQPRVLSPTTARPFTKPKMATQPTRPSPISPSSPLVSSSPGTNSYRTPFPTTHHIRQ